MIQFNQSLDNYLNRKKEQKNSARLQNQEKKHRKILPAGCTFALVGLGSRINFMA